MKKILQISLILTTFSLVGIPLSYEAFAVHCECSGTVSGSCPGSEVPYSGEGDIPGDDPGDCASFCDTKRTEAETAARSSPCVPQNCCECRKPDGSIYQVPTDKASDSARCQNECEAATGGVNVIFVENTPCSAVTSEVPAFSAAPVVVNGMAFSGPVEWTSPISGKSPSTIIGKIIKTVLGIIGAIALLMFVYGGLMWMTPGGSPERIKKAQTTLVWAVLGLVVIFASYTLVDFIINQIGG
jgi:hypothetical protein